MRRKRRDRLVRAGEGRYEPLAADESGVLRSETFPGLWLDAAAMLWDDLAAVLDVLRRGVKFPEHAAFVERPKIAGGSGR